MTFEGKVCTRKPSTVLEPELALIHGDGEPTVSNSQREELT